MDGSESPRRTRNRLCPRCLDRTLVGAAQFTHVRFANAVSLAGVAAWGLATPVILLAIGINCLELFFATVQAYIFTYLTIVFVGSTVRPEH